MAQKYPSLINHFVDNIKIYAPLILSIGFILFYTQYTDRIIFLYAGLGFFFALIFNLFRSHLWLKFSSQILKIYEPNIRVVSKKKDSIFIYSKYKKNSRLLVLLPFLLISIFFIALLFKFIFESSSVEYLFLGLLAILFLFCFFIILSILLMYFPLVKINAESISYQEIDLYNFKLYKTIKTEDLNEIAIGRFIGKYYSSNRRSETYKDNYYWLFYGIDKQGQQHLFLDFDNYYKDLIFNDKWNLKMSETHQIIKAKISKLVISEIEQKLYNPNPSKGAEGWDSIGLIYKK